MREYIEGHDILENEWYIELDNRIYIFDDDDFYVMALMEAHKSKRKSRENVECVNIMAHNIAKHIAITNSCIEENDKLLKENERLLKENELLRSKNIELEAKDLRSEVEYSGLFGKYNKLDSEYKAYKENNKSNYDLYIQVNNELTVIKNNYDIVVNKSTRFETLYNKEVGLHAVTMCQLDEKDKTIDDLSAIISELEIEKDSLIDDKENLIKEKDRLILEINSNLNDVYMYDDDETVTEDDFKRYEARKSKISEELKGEVIVLRDKGNSFNAISSLVGLSYSTVRCILEEAYRLKYVHNGKGDTTNRVTGGGRKSLAIDENRLTELFNAGLSYNEITKVLIKEGLKTATVPTIRNRCKKLGLNR